MVLDAVKRGQKQLKYVETKSVEDLMEDQNPQEVEVEIQAKRKCGEAKRRCTGELPSPQKRTPPKVSPRQLSSFTEIMWSSRPPSWSKKQAQSSSNTHKEEKEARTLVRVKVRRIEAAGVNSWTV